MVRLRSDRWFARDGQRRSRTQVVSKNMATRRLISLCFLLALVVMMMQKAADPRVFSNAFRALGVPFEEAPAEPSHQVGAATHSDRVPTVGEQDRWHVTCADLVPRLLEQATPAQIDALSVHWFGLGVPAIREQTTLPAAEDGLGLAADDRAALVAVQHRTGAQLDTLARSLEDGDEEWSGLLSRFREEWSELWRLMGVVDVEQASDGASLSPALRNVLDGTLDARLVATMRDGSPWMQADHVAFQRMLQRSRLATLAELSDAASLPRVSTEALDSGSNALKGKLVRYRCSLRRQQRVAGETGDPHSAYWSLWARGMDGSPQPIAIYVSTELGDLAGWTVDENAGDFPKVEVTAWVGKRLAYASAAGLEVAPTLFAAQVRVIEQPRSAEVPSAASVRKDAQTALLWASLVAVCLLVPILTSWRRRAVRGARRTAKLLIVTAGMLTSGTCAAWQERPPWAAADDPDARWQVVYQAQVQPMLERLSPETVIAYERGELDALPDALLQCLFALDRLDWAKVRRLASPLRSGEGDQQLVLKRVTCSGQVRLAVPLPLSASQQAWYERSDGSTLYRADVQTTEWIDFSGPASEDVGQMVKVVCQQLPQLWLQGPQLRQPVVVEGVALCAGEEQRVVCILCPRLGWRLSPQEPQIGSPALPEHVTALGRHGWDLAWLDEVQANQERVLRAAETPAFAGFMRAVDHEKQSPANDPAVSPLSVLAQPDEAVGRRVDWPVRIVSGALVRLASEDHVAQFGSDRYYQFDGFVELGEQRIRYRTGGEDLVFDGEFPVTIVTLADQGFGPPVGNGDAQLRWDVGRYARLQGRFYRLWSFASEFVTQRDERARQIAPLVVATQLVPTAAPVQRRSAGEIGWFGYGLCAATLAILAAILWFAFRPGPRRARLR